MLVSISSISSELKLQHIHSVLNFKINVINNFPFSNYYYNKKYLLRNYILFHPSTNNVNTSKN